jgi:nucleotide-binding universal stress UspA family protein
MFYSRILVPIDTNDPIESQKASLKTACEISQQFQSLTHVMSVIPSQYFEGYYPDSTEAVQETKHQLEDLIAETCPQDMRVEMSVEQGAVNAEILRVAQERLIDVIVMGTDESTNSDRCCRSKVAHVALHAPCSVFIVPGVGGTG